MIHGGTAGVGFGAEKRLQSVGTLNEFIRGKDEKHTANDLHYLDASLSRNNVYH